MVINMVKRIVKVNLSFEGLVEITIDNDLDEELVAELVKNLLLSKAVVNFERNYSTEDAAYTEVLENFNIEYDSELEDELNEIWEKIEEKLEKSEYSANGCWSAGYEVEEQCEKK